MWIERERNTLKCLMGESVGKLGTGFIERKLEDSSEMERREMGFDDGRWRELA
jgi:hypothetical protein